MSSILKRTRAENGTAIVELAVALPLLVVILVGTADFARVFFYAMELTTAARAGAQYAAYNQVYASQYDQITTAAQNAAPNISPITVTLSCSPSCSAPSSLPPVCQCAQNNGSGQPWATVSCSSTCATGHMIETVTVQTRKTFTLISRFFPISPTITLTRSATMRVAL